MTSPFFTTYTMTESRKYTFRTTYDGVMGNACENDFMNLMAKNDLKILVIGDTLQILPVYD